MIIAEDIKKMLRALDTNAGSKINERAKNRKFLRSEVKWPATIRAERGHACLHEEEREVTGIIKDISANGARIDVDGLFFEKNNLLLNIPKLGTVRCDLVWRRGNKIGLQFSEDPKRILEQLRKILPGIDDILS
ncbi:PilZ domain-containing protein [Sneathiella sp.]|uniref:PilZ domain-containing protein n=1 Tax=Sneathiella sp. TaxID=1964365 RepID=UPI003567A0CC